MRKRHAALLPVAKMLGHEFATIELLEEALTHSSARDRASNERLEFLGDRVLGLVIAAALVDRYPDENEGQLAPRYNALVCRDTCAEIAGALDLGAHLTMARSEALGGGRRKSALLANTMEAVIAAVFLDGGLPAAERLILRHWTARLDRQAEAPIDPKTALQEWAQARAMPLPHYETIARSGPDHAPVFTIRVSLANGRMVEAEAPSKRAAERIAAQTMIQILGDHA